MVVAIMSGMDSLSESATKLREALPDNFVSIFYSFNGRLSTFEIAMVLLNYLLLEKKNLLCLVWIVLCLVIGKVHDNNGNLNRVILK